MKTIFVCSILFITLTGCWDADIKASITELNEIKQQITDHLDEFGSQGIQIRFVVLDEEKRKVLVLSDNITEEQKSMLQNQFGPNKVEILIGENVLF